MLACLTLCPRDRLEQGLRYKGVAMTSQDSIRYTNSVEVAKQARDAPPFKLWSLDRVASCRLVDCLVVTKCEFSKIGDPNIVP